MANAGLLDRIEMLRADFKSIRGEPFKYFFCPILMRDEQTEMCRGHIVSEALGNSNEWVPQRKDVDNFFGHAVEAAMKTVVENRDKSLEEIVGDPKLRKQISVKLMDGDKEIKHYFFDPKRNVGTEHAKANLIGPDNELIANIAIKMDLEELLAKNDGQIEFVIDRDFRPAVVASMIKAAHLSLFKLFGYYYIFTYTGYYLSSILRDFYEQYSTTNLTEADVKRFFFRFESMVLPIESLGDNVEGTFSDGRIIMHLNPHDEPFAMGVIVRAGTRAFSVIVPGIAKCIDTYFSFLAETPSSVLIKNAQFKLATETEAGCLLVQHEAARRISLRWPSEEEEADGR